MKTLDVKGSFLYVKLASLLRTSKSSFITGAGISTSAGISDFRSKNGLFSEIKKRYGYSGEDIFTHSVVYGSEQAMEIYIELISEMKKFLVEAVPTPSHKMLAHLQRAHKVSIYTQNIDGLEGRAGLERGVYYLHGSLDSLACTYCHHRTPYTLEHNKMLAQRIPCESCAKRRAEREQQKKRMLPQGTMMPDIVLYGGPHDTTETARSVAKEKDTALLIVMGTSLRVFGVKNLLKTISKTVKNNEGVRVYVGIEPPPKPMQVYFDYWIEGKCDDFSKTLMDTIQGSLLLKKIKHSREIDHLVGSMKRLSIDPGVDWARLLCSRKAS
ncbi:NAD+-dependent protein deacetylase SIR2 [Nematocida major]|uniref:NAD+-dependent protein deacetylase SIR2 n=1 Tax=Nematocida major TaxID=1912982 RepID=UPI0020086F5F|nr:NAD+-dependent protein deacetylase SIR2 [Nematocida major]KAH9386061.1 NAD+-dependent protein deacetylase SIR2 [Nematocida major]